MVILQKLADMMCRQSILSQEVHPVSQDLSIAGKRAGLDGERSGLFMEQIRVIREMRDYDRRNNGISANEFIRPRWMVWENVAGAFSSNKGEDFRVVLEETARVADKDAVIPGLEGGQRWSPSGCVMGDGWSIAWRLHDAQFWGVPQRRKRIALVADFGGPTAPEILFERKSVSGNLEQSGTEGQSFAGDAGLCAEESSGAYSFLERGGKPGGGKGILVSNEQTGPLLSQNSQAVCSPCLNSWDVQSKHIQPENGIAEALYSGECRGGGGESYVMQGIDKVAETLDASYYKGCGERQGKERTVVYGISSDGSNAMRSDNPHSGIYEADTTRTLDNNGGNPACNQGGMIVLEGNGTRESHKGDGYRESETMYTLNTVEQHAVCVGNGQLAQARLSDKVGALNCMHDQQAVMVFEPGAATRVGGHIYEDSTGSLRANAGDNQQAVMVLNDQGGSQMGVTEDSTSTLRAEDHGHPPLVFGIDRASFNQGKNAQYNFAVDEDLAQTVLAKGPGGGY